MSAESRPTDRVQNWFSGCRSARCDNFFSHALGHRAVLVELHRVARSTLCQTTKRRRVAEHLAQRALGGNHADAGATILGVDDHAATARDVTGHVAEELLGRGDDDLHDRLEQHAAGLGNRFAEGEPGSLLEGDLRAVHRVVRAVDQLGLDVDQRVAGGHTTGRGLADADLDRRDELLGHRTADDLVLEGNAINALHAISLGLFLRVRTKVDRDVAELTATTRLLDELATPVGGLALGPAHKPVPQRPRRAATAKPRQHAERGFGGLRGLVPLRMMLGNIGVLVTAKQVAISFAHKEFNEAGKLSDDKYSMVEDVVKELALVAKKQN